MYFSTSSCSLSLLLVCVGLIAGGRPALARPIPDPPAASILQTTTGAPPPPASTTPPVAGTTTPIQTTAASPSSPVAPAAAAVPTSIVNEPPPPPPPLVSPSKRIFEQPAAEQPLPTPAAPAWQDPNAGTEAWVDPSVYGIATTPLWESYSASIYSDMPLPSSLPASSSSSSHHHSSTVSSFAAPSHLPIEEYPDIVSSGGESQHAGQSASSSHNGGIHWDGAKAAGAFLGLLVFLSLVCFVLVKICVRRKQTRAANEARIWQYLTPSPRADRDAQTFEKTASRNDLDPGMIDIEKSADAAENQDSTFEILVMGPEDTNQTPRQVQPSRLSVPATPVAPEKTHQPARRGGSRRRGVMHITKNFPRSRFSVTSSDYEDEGCVSDKRGTRTSSFMSIDSLSHRPNSVSSWGSAASGETTLPHDDIPVVKVTHGVPLEMARDSILQVQKRGRVSSPPVSWAPLPARTGTH